MPLKRAQEARAETALGRPMGPASGSGEGPLDSPAQMVMTPCLLPQEEQSGSAGKAKGRGGRWLCCVGGSGSPGTEVGEGEGSREQPDTDPPLAVCQIPPHLHPSGEGRSGRRGGMQASDSSGHPYI